MKIRNIVQLNDFVDAINKCDGEVWLESSEGDRFDLKSLLSRYYALGALLSAQGDYLELFCSMQQDEAHFYAFFANHPEVQGSLKS